MTEICREDVPHTRLTPHLPCMQDFFSDASNCPTLKAVLTIVTLYYYYFFAVVVILFSVFTGKKFCWPHKTTAYNQEEASAG